jgi:hypothetical protein
MAVFDGIVALVAALYLHGTWGSDPDEQETGRRAATPEPTAAPAGDGDGGKKKRRKAAPERVRLQIQPSGPVSVCLEDAAGKALIRNVTLDAGQDSETFRSAKRLRVSFGTSAAVMRVDGKEYPVSEAAPIGYELRPGRKPRALSEDARPTCVGWRSARASSSPAPRGCRASSPTATAPGCRSGCASRASSWRTSWSSATARTTCARRSGSSRGRASS